VILERREFGLIATKGRPKYDLNVDDLAELLDEGFKGPAIAEIYGVAPQTVYNRIHEFGLMSSVSITDEDLLKVYVVMHYLFVVLVIVLLLLCTHVIA
jgi:hypothetical protein